LIIKEIQVRLTCERVFGGGEIPGVEVPPRGKKRQTALSAPAQKRRLQDRVRLTRFAVHASMGQNGVRQLCPLRRKSGACGIEYV